MKKNLRKCDKLYILLFVARAVFVSYIFYKSIILSFVVGAAAVFVGVRFEKKRRQKKYRSKLELEFREGLQGIAAALSAGYAVENAFGEAQKELVTLYGAGSVLVPEFEIIKKEISLNRTVESSLSSFANRCGVEDVKRFSDIFQTAKRTGGDLISITKSTADRISEKIEVSREIETLISGKKMEARIMTVIPIGIILYFWMCSPGFLDSLYVGSGRIIMTVFLGIYILAYVWSGKICEINI